MRRLPSALPEVAPIDNVGAQWPRRSRWRCSQHCQRRHARTRRCRQPAAIRVEHLTPEAISTPRSAVQRGVAAHRSRRLEKVEDSKPQIAQIDADPRPALQNHRNTKTQKRQSQTDGRRRQPIPFPLCVPVILTAGRGICVIRGPCFTICVHLRDLRFLFQSGGGFVSLCLRGSLFLPDRTCR